MEIWTEFFKLLKKVIREKLQTPPENITPP